MLGLELKEAVVVLDDAFARRMGLKPARSRLIKPEVALSLLDQLLFFSSPLKDEFDKISHVRDSGTGW